jgi:hypothetical protein
MISVDTYGLLAHPQGPFGGLDHLQRLSLEQWHKARKYVPVRGTSSVVSPPRTSRSIINACLRLESPESAVFEPGVGTAFRSGI